jgi:hypothetical protein
MTIPQTTVRVITNGNDPQVPLILGLAESIRLWSANHPGAWNLQVLSDGLSDRSVDALKAHLLDPLLCDQRFFGPRMELFTSDLHAFGKIGKPLFLFEYLHRYVTDNPPILYCDPDVVATASLDGLLAHLTRGSVAMPCMLYPTDTYQHTLQQLSRAPSINPAGPEVCTGVMLGYADDMRGFLEEWIQAMVSPELNPLRFSSPKARNAWHDQDFFRYFIRLRQFRGLTLIPFHIAPTIMKPCHRLFDIGLTQREDHVRAISVKHWGWKNDPILCHFAGLDYIYREIPALQAYYSHYHEVL